MKLVVYDATDTKRVLLPRITRRADGAAEGTGGLTRFWRIGAGLHWGIGRASATLGARSWIEALAWAADFERIDELQVWGHGGWGYMDLGGERLDVETANGALSGSIDRLRLALSPVGAPRSNSQRDPLVWLRCCSAFGTRLGHSFARELASRLGARVAGHTHIIGVWQSGTHSVAPGEAPAWDADEGVERDASGAPTGAAVSSAHAPRTIHCLRPGLPQGW
jgi:hypothetical protein